MEFELANVYSIQYSPITKNIEFNWPLTMIMNFVNMHNIQYSAVKKHDWLISIDQLQSGFFFFHKMD
jgi:hypothetical protein